MRFCKHVAHRQKSTNREPNGIRTKNRIMHWDICIFSRLKNWRNHPSLTHCFSVIFLGAMCLLYRVKSCRRVWCAKLCRSAVSSLWIIVSLDFENCFKEMEFFVNYKIGQCPRTYKFEHHSCSIPCFIRFQTKCLVNPNFPNTIQVYFLIFSTASLSSAWQTSELLKHSQVCSGLFYY